MRTSFLLLALAALALGCGPGLDPSLGACSARKPGAVVLGTGQEIFEAIPGAGVRINHGSQGGEHIWLGLSCQNLGPRVTARFKITDVASGLEISQHGLAQVVNLEYDGAGSDRTAGIYGYLELGFPQSDEGIGSGGGGGSGGAAPALPNDLTGRTIKIATDVSDDCKKPAIHAEVTTVIAGG